jgi:hypothetical protein
MKGKPSKPRDRLQRIYTWHVGAKRETRLPNIEAAESHFCGSQIRFQNPQLLRFLPARDSTYLPL